MKRVIYPGSFDPITKGHMNIIEQASNLFDEILVVVMKNPNKKNSMFTEEERAELIKEIYKDNNQVKVLIGEGATVDVAEENNCCAILRGLRSLTDYNYEVEMQQFNQDISNNNIKTICLFADKNYQFLSSSIVKEVFSLNKDISKYVDPVVIKKMQEKR